MEAILIYEWRQNDVQDSFVYNLLNYRVRYETILYDFHNLFGNLCLNAANNIRYTFFQQF